MPPFNAIEYTPPQFSARPGSGLFIQHGSATERKLALVSPVYNVRPPSTTITWPVINSERARNTTVSATSEGLPDLRSASLMKSFPFGRISHQSSRRNRIHAHSGASSFAKCVSMTRPLETQCGMYPVPRQQPAHIRKINDRAAVRSVAARCLRAEKGAFQIVSSDASHTCSVVETILMAKIRRAVHQNIQPPKLFPVSRSTLDLRNIAEVCRPPPMASDFSHF
jgi:hypothetical protein